MKKVMKNLPVRAVVPGIVCMLSLMVFPVKTWASVTCTGWGTQESIQVDLRLPDIVALPLNSVAGTVLATGRADLPPPMRCADNASGRDITRTNWMWNLRYDPDTDSIMLTRGIGLKLAWKSDISGGISSGGVLPGDGGEADTSGFNWSQLNWTLVRTREVSEPGQIIAGTTGAGTLNGPGGSRRLFIQQSSPVNVTAACVLATDKSTVQLPDTDVSVLEKYGHSDSVALTTYVTCPANVSVSGTLTMNTASADSTDGELVGNSGSATGVAIEVLNNADGKRLSAKGGQIHFRFRQDSSTVAPGAKQQLDVRMVRLNGHQLTAGTVQGIFTLTLSVN